jgi:peptide/nickel transport system ATP-binding protein
MTLLSVSQFSAQTTDKSLVKNMSFSLSEGSITGIVGESGSGKSVTCMGLTRLLPKSIQIQGKVMFTDTHNREIDLLNCEQETLRNLRGKEISYIFQEPMTALNPVHTCGYQVEEVLAAHQNLNKTECKKKVLELFEEVKLPDVERIYASYPHQISGGQRQRVMISMAIANDPRLLIADEPTTALDASVQKSIIDLLVAMVKQRNMAMIFISHDLGCLRTVADEILVMYQGNMVETGTSQHIFNHAKHPYTKALMKTRPHYGQAGNRLPTIPDLLIEKADGTFEEKLFHTEKMSALPVGEPVLEIKDLEKTYARKLLFRKKSPNNPVLNKISFTVHQGTTIGIVGESGCGKSTLAKILTGLEKSTQGKIIFHNRQSRGIGRNIQMVFQDPFSSLNPSITGGEAIMEPMLVHKMANKKEAKQKALHLLNLTGLNEEFFYKYPHQMSGGQRQRLCIARALSTEPSILILDEAVAALDVSVQSQILNLLKDIQLKLNLTYLFISHDLNVVGYMADSIMVLKNGIIEEQGSPTDIIQNPKSDYTRFLIKSMYE